ncbi:hypothetical protein [Aurantibacillus circumpalustris]|uniref:hypothetical protein n=1 Tax=Aurantibacillus circumpalustris TaxID=3036359 RepID=UPI00295BF3B2|nr:hypothetical protein [Aurantibacillus circumpalustris]
MKIPFTKIIALIFLGFSTSIYKAQEPQTIRVKKESNLAKVVFDITDPRLFVVDRFGNPRENKILSYKLYVKGKRETKEFSGHSNRLNQEMLTYLRKQTVATKIFFTEISAEDDDGHLIKLPDAIDVWFPDCKNCEKKKR